MSKNFEVGDFVYFMNYEVCQDGIPKGKITNISYQWCARVKLYIPTYYIVCLELFKDKQKGIMITDKYIKSKIYNSGHVATTPRTSSYYKVNFGLHISVSRYFQTFERLTFKSYKKASEYYEIFLKTIFYIGGPVMIHSSKRNCRFWNDWYEDGLYENKNYKPEMLCKNYKVEAFLK